MRNRIVEANFKWRQAQLMVDYSYKQLDLAVAKWVEVATVDSMWVFNPKRQWIAYFNKMTFSWVVGKEIFAVTVIVRSHVTLKRSKLLRFSCKKNFLTFKKA